jgi:selenocysteine lyase/cysteine desulfurase
MNDSVDWPAFRANFPSLNGRVYLNTAGGGAVSEQAAAAGIRYYREAVKHADTYWDEWLKRSDNVRQQVAAFIGTDPESVAFVQNTSLAFNLLARQFNRHLNVIALDREFPSCTTPWLAAGHHVKFFPSLPDGSLSAAHIDQFILPETDALVLSSVQFADGYRVDVQAIGQRCRDRGILFVVDATQSICAFDIHMERDLIDALIFSGYKWATAGYGNAVLAVKESLRDPCSQNGLIGWRSAKEPYLLENNRIELTPSAIRYEMGHPSFPSVFTLSAAIELFQEVGISAVSERVKVLSRRMRGGLRESGWSIASDTEQARGGRSISGITLVETNQATEITARLKSNGVWTSARAGGIRVSVHAYNTEAEVDTFCDRLGEAN